jgi:hypothetical protein
VAYNGHHTRSIYLFEEKPMTKDRIVPLLLVICVVLTACNLPSSAPTELASGDASPTFTPFTAETATNTPAAVAACTPSITTNTDANVRNGPGTVYGVIGIIPAGGTAPVDGKNFDGTWWYIEFAGSFGWIAGSVTTATCIPPTLPVIAAPPTPIIPPTNTPAPTIAPSITPTGSFVLPLLPLFPLLILGDIKIQEVFLSTGGEIVLRIAVDPSGSLSGLFKYKVWVDGSLQANNADTLPSGSAAFYSGVVPAFSIFDPNVDVHVKVDSADAIAENNEGNNELFVTCNMLALTC